MQTYLDSVFDGALGEMRHKSRNRLYQSDPDAWLWDVLGKRWYSRQSEIAQSFIHNTRTAVKSANGCGKSAVVADLITWVVATTIPQETLCIVSAPTMSQVEKVIFAYLKVNKGAARLRGMDLPGRITEMLEWKLDGSDGAEFLVFGKRPPDQDIVNSFQGTRKKNTKVFLDEGGGLPPAMFTAAEAVATGAGSGQLVIGNPDNRGTEFYKIFNDPVLMQDWSRYTISAFDLPTFTGEIVYEDPEKQQSMLDGLTSVEWVEHKKRAWGIDSARYKSKVLGEFPDEADTSFFSQKVIDRAADTDIPVDEDIRPILGLDVARFGSDENVLFSNQGGRVREIDRWSKLDLIETARRAHGHAQRLVADILNVDVNGVGGGVVDSLLRLDEFVDAVYSVGSINGANSSPDVARWHNARAWHYDTFRELAATGDLDLPFEDKKLREEMISQTYKFSPKGAILMTSKEEMRKHGISSPDTLDAAILCTIDHAGSGLSPGDIVQADEDDDEPAFYGDGYW